MLGPSKKVTLTWVRDLSVLLKDLEPLVKDPKFLRTGRKFRNFPLLPREVLANWLLCVVMNYQNESNSVTISTDPEGGDGLILNLATGVHMVTEHVFVPEIQSVLSTVEDQIINAIRAKARFGRPYASGKHLIVFSEAVGLWYPNRAARRVKKKTTRSALFGLLI